MNYLLSDGSICRDAITYIQDLFRLHLLIRIDEVPYWNGGSNDIIKDMSEKNLEVHINGIIGEIIKKITEQFTTVKLTMSELSVSNSVVHIVININGINSTYDIQRQA